VAVANTEPPREFDPLNSQPQTPQPNPQPQTPLPTDPNQQTATPTHSNVASAVTSNVVAAANAAPAAQGKYYIVNGWHTINAVEL